MVRTSKQKLFFDKRLLASCALRIVRTERESHSSQDFGIGIRKKGVRHPANIGAVKGAAASGSLVTGLLGGLRIAARSDPLINYMFLRSVSSTFAVPLKD